MDKSAKTDKEAQEKMGDFIYETLRVDPDIPIGNRAYIADVLSEKLHKEGYRKLPKQKPPLLSDQKIANLLDIAVNEKKSMLASRNDIAQAQRDICIKHYEG